MRRFPRVAIACTLMAWLVSHRCPMQIVRADEAKLPDQYAEVVLDVRGMI